MRAPGCFFEIRFFCQVLVITQEIGWNIVLGKSARGIRLAKLGIAYCRLCNSPCERRTQSEF